MQNSEVWTDAEPDGRGPGDGGPADDVQVENVRGDRGAGAGGEECDDELRGDVAKGVSGCSRRSRMGTATGTAEA
jgi:hypothetical protein